QSNAIFVFHIHVEVHLVESRLAVVLVVDDKLMQVAVFPAHGGLDDVVKFAEGAVRHLDPPPDRRLDAAERDLELVDLARSWGWGGLSWLRLILPCRARRLERRRFRFRHLDPGPLRLDPELGPDDIEQGIADL